MAGLVSPLTTTVCEYREPPVKSRHPSSMSAETVPAEGRLNGGDASPSQEVSPDGIFAPQVHEKRSGLRQNNLKNRNAPSSPYGANFNFCSDLMDAGLISSGVANILQGVNLKISRHQECFPGLNDALSSALTTGELSQLEMPHQAAVNGTYDDEDEDCDFVPTPSETPNNDNEALLGTIPFASATAPLGLSSDASHSIFSGDMMDLMGLTSAGVVANLKQWVRDCEASQRRRSTGLTDHALRSAAARALSTLGPLSSANLGNQIGSATELDSVLSNYQPYSSTPVRGSPLRKATEDAEPASTKSPAQGNTNVGGNSPQARGLETTESGSSSAFSTAPSSGAVSFETHQQNHSQSNLQNQSQNFSQQNTLQQQTQNCSQYASPLLQNGTTLSQNTPVDLMQTFVSSAALFDQLAAGMTHLSPGNYPFPLNVAPPPGIAASGQQDPSQSLEAATVLFLNQLHTKLNAAPVGMTTHSGNEQGFSFGKTNSPSNAQPSSSLGGEYSPLQDAVMPPEKMTLSRDPQRQEMDNTSPHGDIRFVPSADLVVSSCPSQSRPSQQDIGAAVLKPSGSGSEASRQQQQQYTESLPQSTAAGAVESALRSVTQKGMAEVLEDVANLLQCTIEQLNQVRQKHRDMAAEEALPTDLIEILENMTAAVNTLVPNYLELLAEARWLSPRAPVMLAHPDEFKNPSSFLKIYGDPQCRATSTGPNAAGPNMGQHPRRGRDGNWTCQKCLNINYPRRFRCNNPGCKALRGIEGDRLVSDYARTVFHQYLSTTGASSAALLSGLRATANSNLANAPQVPLLYDRYPPAAGSSAPAVERYPAPGFTAHHNTVSTTQQQPTPNFIWRPQLQPPQRQMPRLPLQQSGPNGIFFTDQPFSQVRPPTPLNWVLPNVTQPPPQFNYYEAPSQQSTFFPNPTTIRNNGTTKFRQRRERPVDGFNPQFSADFNNNPMHLRRKLSSMDRVQPAANRFSLTQNNAGSAGIAGTADSHEYADLPQDHKALNHVLQGHVLQGRNFNASGPQWRNFQTNRDNNNAPRKPSGENAQGGKAREASHLTKMRSFKSTSEAVQPGSTLTSNSGSGSREHPGSSPSTRELLYHHNRSNTGPLITTPPALNKPSQIITPEPELRRLESAGAAKV